MELVDGPSLAQVRRSAARPASPVREAVDYARQACEALAYVHDEHMIHRDVKPENLILGGDGVVLVDFGIAREPRTRAEGTAAVGTPGFMAPEVIAGAVSRRSDVFGVAATLWTLLAGEPPRHGDSVALGVDARLEAALRAGLEPDPNRRTPSAETFPAAIGARLPPTGGAPLAVSVEEPAIPATLLEAVVRAAPACSTQEPPRSPCSTSSPAS